MVAGSLFGSAPKAAMLKAKAIAATISGCNFFIETGRMRSAASRQSEKNERLVVKEAAYVCTASMIVPTIISAHPIHCTQPRRS